MAASVTTPLLLDLMHKKGGVFMIATSVMSFVSILLTAVVGILVSRLNRRIEESDKEKERKDQAKLEHTALMVHLTMASLSLGITTAEAIQRIPDANCNGEMHEALSFAKEAKREYRDFQQRQTAERLN